MSERKCLLLKNGIILDGTDSPSFKADIVISEGKIQDIGQELDIDSSQIIDAKDLIICPGFIDIHSHSDYSLFFDNRLESMICQGVTTSVVGNCGSSLAPITDEQLGYFEQGIEKLSPPGVKMEITWRTFAEYLTEIEKLQISINIIPLVGFGNIRIVGGPGNENREPTKVELVNMKSYVKEAMKAGAFGMSTGLIYPPDIYAKTSEIIEIAKTVAKFNGLYFSHIRGESETVVSAVKELIEIVEKSSCRGGQIAHHKIAGEKMWGKSKQTLKLIEQANEKGLDITCDQYPYNRGMTSLVTVLPPWVHEGGTDAILERLENSEVRNKIKQDIQRGIEGWENMLEVAGMKGIYISKVKTKKWQGIEGKNIPDIQKERGYSDGLDLIFDMLLDERCGVDMTIEDIGEEDIRRIMKHPFTMFGTDGWGVSPTGVLSHGKPHPRFYGTYPRILGRYVKEEKVLTLQEAIHKMTSLPARKIGLKDRGIIREGFWADIVIFDPETIIDKATYNDPHQFPEGIHYVIVNGIVVVENGKQGDFLPGKVLRHAA
jgi:N-acyl-D-amino-acid deacylase